MEVADRQAESRGSLKPPRRGVHSNGRWSERISARSACLPGNTQMSAAQAGEDALAERMRCKVLTTVGILKCRSIGRLHTRSHISTDNLFRRPALTGVEGAPSKM